MAMPKEGRAYGRTPLHTVLQRDGLWLIPASIFLGMTFINISPTYHSCGWWDRIGKHHLKSTGGGFQTRSDRYHCVD